MARDKKERVPEPEPDDVRYGAAVAEIEQILASIDRDEIDIDELSTKVERAVELLKVCRAKLRATELRVTEVLKDVQPEEDVSEDEAEAADDEAGGSPDAKPSRSAKRGKKGASEPPQPDEELPF